MSGINIRPLPSFLLLSLIAVALTCGGCSDSALAPTESAIPATTKAAPTDADPAHDSYFPLHEGGVWIYVLENAPEELVRHYERQDGVQLIDDVLVAEVAIAGVRMMGERQVFDVGNYLFPYASHEVRFFNESPGLAMELVAGEPALWYPWHQFADGDPARILLPENSTDCIHGSEGIYPGFLFTTHVPAGTFRRTATIHYYERPCGNAGVVTEVFAPGVGLIQRTVMTPHGPRAWSLAYAAVGGRRWGTMPEVD
jgi:hypothetical protein